MARIQGGLIRLDKGSTEASGVEEPVGHIHTKKQGDRRGIPHGIDNAKDMPRDGQHVANESTASMPLRWEEVDEAKPE